MSGVVLIHLLKKPVEFGYSALIFDKLFPMCLCRFLLPDDGFGTDFFDKVHFVVTDVLAYASYPIQYQITDDLCTDEVIGTERLECMPAQIIRGAGIEVGGFMEIYLIAAPFLILFLRLSAVVHLRFAICAEHDTRERVGCA